MTENEASNLTYDLAEGPHATLKGSMNEALEHAPAGYGGMLLSLMQRTAEHQSTSNTDEMVLHDKQAYENLSDTVSKSLDTNVMYDPVSGEGLVCVNGRCISNKRKFQVHDEKHIGLKSGNRRRDPPSRRKKIKPGGKKHGKKKHRNGEALGRRRFGGRDMRR